MSDLIPNHARLPLTHGALKKHRGQHPATFEKIIRKEDAQYRYHSNDPAICRGEYLLSILPPHQTDWVMFIALEEDEKWYGLHAKSNTVVRERIAHFDVLLSDFDYPLHQSELIYINCEDIPERLTALFGEKLAMTDVSLNAIPPQYGLKPLNRFSAKYGIAIGALSLCAIGGLLTLSQTEPPPPPPINPWESWSQHYLSLNVADHALQNSAQLLAFAWTLPVDWQLKKMELAGNNVGITVSPKPNAKQSSLMAWLKKSPKNITTSVNGQEILLSLPLNTKNEPVLYVIGDYHKRLYDDLSRLGVDALTMTNTPGSNNTQQWTYHFKLQGHNIHSLITLSRLITTKPVFIHTFSVTALTPPLLDANITLTLIGQ